MPKLSAAVFLILGLFCAGVASAAEMAAASFSPGSKAALMSDDEMDAVTAGSLSNLFPISIIVLVRPPNASLQFSNSQVNVTVIGGADVFTFVATTPLGTFTPENLPLPSHKPPKHGKH